MKKLPQIIITSLFFVFLLISSCGLGDSSVLLTDLEFVTEGEERIAHHNGKAFTGIVKTVFPSGAVQTSENYVNGLREGTYEIFFESGQVFKSGTINNGKENGLYEEFYASGIRKYEYFYANGEMTGVWKSWYENKQPWTQRDFKMDKLNGKVLVWDETGILRKEYWYSNGNLTKKETYFDEE